MDWLKKLLGIDKIEGDIAVLKDVQVAAAEYITERMDKIELTIAELPTVEEMFEIGIVRLSKNDVYILHVSENIKPEEIDILQREMTRIGIKCVIISADKMSVLNFSTKT